MVVSVLPSSQIVVLLQAIAIATFFMKKVARDRTKFLLDPPVYYDVVSSVIRPKKGAIGVAYATGGTKYGTGTLNGTAVG